MARRIEFLSGMGPMSEIQNSAATYRTENGIARPRSTDYSGVVMPRTASRQIARAYDKLPDFDQRALPAFHAMRREVGKQFEHMTRPTSRGGLGLHVEVSDNDPYQEEGVNGIIRRARSDVVNNNRLKVLSTRATGGHAVFSNDENDQFRAVHDLYGHIGSGRGVDIHGEEAAYQKHASMFTPLARQALATETRGQNAGLHATGDFPEQKVGILPAHMQAAQFATARSTPTELRRATDHARMRHFQQGLGQ
jgi:hypothetical protein